MRQADAVCFGYKPEQIPVAIKAPGPALLNDFDAGLGIAVKELVGDTAGGVFVGQFEGFGTIPLGVNDRHQTVRKDAFDGSVGPEVFEFAHRSIITPLRQIDDVG